MADLMTQLAARTLGLAPVVQPRIAPIFAPGQGGMENGGADMHRSETAVSVSQPSTEEATGGVTRSAPAPSQHSLTPSGLTPLVAPTHQTLAIAHLPRAEYASPPAVAPPSFEPVIPVEPNLEHPVNIQDEREAVESANLTSSPTSLVLPPTNLSVSHSTLDEPPGMMDVSLPPATAASAIPSTSLASSRHTNPPPTSGSEAKLIEEPSVPPEPRRDRGEQTHQGVAPLPIRPTAETTTTSQFPSVQPANHNTTSMSQLSGASDRQPPVSSVSQPSVQPANHNTTSMSQLQPLVDRGNPSLIPQVDREVTRSTQTSTVTPQAVPRPPIGIESAQANPLNPHPSVMPLVPQTAQSVNPRIEANSSRLEPSFTPRLAQGQQPQSVTPSQPEPTPTIHITIGRIDIRAVPASTPTRPRPTATPPKQSLQDYLNSRNGGRG